MGRPLARIVPSEFGARFSVRTARRPLLAVVLLSAALVVAALLGTATGPMPIPWQDVAGTFLSYAGVDRWAPSERERLVIEQLRLPRVAAAMLTGMALAVSGATMQALFRNPMADPGLLGVSAGAAAGAVVAIAFGLRAASIWTVPATAFAGAMGAVLLVTLLGAAAGRGSMIGLLLAGIAVSSFLGAVMSVIVAVVPRDEELRGILYWLAGGFSGASWEHVRAVSVPIIVASAAICLFGRDLNLLMLGDETARSSGVEVMRVRFGLLGLAALATGSAVAVSGTIGFVGLIVPHAVRLVLGPDNRILLPGSCLTGAVFLLLADTFAKSVTQPAEIQVGMITALCGAPVFALLLLRQGRSSSLSNSF